MDGVLHDTRGLLDLNAICTRINILHARANLNSGGHGLAKDGALLETERSAGLAF